MVAFFMVIAASSSARAGGPRWVSGPPYFTNWRVLVAWYTNQPLYFTDPGDLSASVNHAAADVLVAQAAAVWNVPTASLVLAKGGSLNQHVSGANVYASVNGPVFPSDVQSSNYVAKQIAIIYDSDGSVTDQLLGSGASEPSGCLQTGVTESVDLIAPQGQIQHALLILNGRCTGPEPEKQLQLQYQLVRAFGRILGLAWSQTNDNVFTGSPMPSQVQALNWPLMHPIDILCGAYTYQCLPQPFTLRPDDISALEELYFVSSGQGGPGKQESWSNAGGSYGFVSFPNGQGMEGVNVVARRVPAFSDTAETWETASSVTGYAFRGQSPTSMASSGTSAAASMGVADGNREGYYRIQSIPIPASEGWNNVLISTEPVNPLYTGPYAIGPQVGDTISPSGSTPPVQMIQYLAAGRDGLLYFTPSDAVASCPVQNDGTESAPAAVSSQGWWTGTLCGYQHEAWSSLQVKANRTLTLEMTALDENGLVSMTKAMPIVGVWKSTDATGTLPTVASAPAAFNSLSVGMTSLRVQSSASASLRIALADQRGAGRPDFAYQARALYADSISPANVNASGGTITINGMGFRQGNTVTVNGVMAAVTSWSQTSIVATVPSLHALGLSRATVASITVTDISTGGTSVMSGVLSYSAPVEALQLLSAPSGANFVGSPAQTSFSVQAIAPDGFTPIVGESVTFTASGAVMSPCPTGTCTLLTNANGIATVTVTPTTPGSVTLSAAGRSGTVLASFTASANTDVFHLVSAPTGTVTSGKTAANLLSAQLLTSDGVTPRAGSSITLTLVGGSAQFGACSTLPCTLQTSAAGLVATTVTPTSSGIISVRLASASSSVQASFSAAAETMQLITAPTGSQVVGVTAPASFAVRVLGGDGVTPVMGETVVFTATGATINFGACNGPVCTLTTDTQGAVQSTVTALTAGSVTLSAVGSAGSSTAPFTAVAAPDHLHMVSAPSGTVYVGDSVAYAVRITAADDVTPVAGKPVTFSVRAGAVTWGGSAAPVYVVTTDGTGLASAPLSAVASGVISLQATSEAGSMTASFTAFARLRSVVAARPVQYVAEGADISFAPQVTLSDNSMSPANIQVSWTGAPGISFPEGVSRSDGNGVASSSAVVAPLSAGVRVQGQACAWGNICSALVVQAVAASDWRVRVLTGAAQSVQEGNALATVAVQIVNATGDPVAGAAVQIAQTITSWEAACPVDGRCPPASVLSSSRAPAVSDLNGMVYVTPAQIIGSTGLTQIAIIAGSQGFATLSLETHP